MINDPIVVLGYQDRSRPVEPVARPIRGLAEIHLRPGHDRSREAGGQVQLFDNPLVTAAVYIARIARAHADMGSLAPWPLLPIAHSDRTGVASAADYY